MTADIIQFTFSDAKFGCKNEEVVYTTQYVDSYYNNYANYNYNNKNDDKQAEAAEWCQYLSNNEMGVSPVSMYDCGSSSYGNYYNQYSNDNYNQYSYLYSWYQYDISEDSAVDMSSVCQIVRKSKGNLKTYYNGNNGHLYSYKSKSSASQEIEQFLEETENHSVVWSKAQVMSAGAKLGAIAGVGIVVGALVAVVVYNIRFGSSDKKEPLMVYELEEDKPEGIMA
jgi:hypothetical protein